MAPMTPPGSSPSVIRNKAAAGYKTPSPRSMQDQPAEDLTAPAAAGEREEESPCTSRIARPKNTHDRVHATWDLPYNFCHQAVRGTIRTRERIVSRAAATELRAAPT